MVAERTTPMGHVEGRPAFPRASGFTLVEVIISLAVLCLLFGTVFSITAETFAFIGENEADGSVQSEANQGIERMTEILRKCGWYAAGGVTYPRVTNGGSEIEFRVLRDLDGNGWAFSEASGEKEYGPAVYTIRRDAAGNLRVFTGGVPVWHLCRHVEGIRFETYLQNPALQLKEIRITIRARRTTRRGDTIDCELAGSIHMRN